MNCQSHRGTVFTNNKQYTQENITGILKEKTCKLSLLIQRKSSKKCNNLGGGMRMFSQLLFMVVLVSSSISALVTGLGNGNGLKCEPIKIDQCSMYNSTG